VGSGEVSLSRLLKPQTIAVVGLSDNSRYTQMVEPTLQSNAQVFFVNPNYPTVLGHPTVPSLSSLDCPIDVVASFMSAERTTALVEEACGRDVGGMVLVAAMFAENGAEGLALQERITKAAVYAGIPVIGPNGLGYVNVRHGISLTIAGRHRRRPGGMSVVSQSGAMLSGVAMAAWGYDGVGQNVIVSAGNEAVTDLADYVDYFVDDPETTSIGLVIETVRRPEAFFAAVRRATDMGKPIVALKLARNERTRKMALSHTAAVAGNAWAYDVALRQAGVALAYDPEELVDRLAMFEQIPRSRWSRVEKLGVVTRTGGFASLSFDLAQAEGVPVPAFDSFLDWAHATLPGVTVPNPLDATSLGAPLWPQIVEKYARCDEIDALLLIHPVAEEDELGSSATVADFAQAAAVVSKPCVLANCSGMPGEWTKPLLGDAAAMGRGVRSTIRGLQSLGAFVQYTARTRPEELAVAPVGRPAVSTIPTPEGQLLPFDATMAILSEFGIPVAPYLLVPQDHPPAAAQPGFPGPYVVKLANVAHRTEHDAVRLDVEVEDLPARIDELRAIAIHDGLLGATVIQPFVKVIGETLIGIQGASELGPLVVFGLGGIFIEALNRVGGRMAPFPIEQARQLIDEFESLGVMHGARGRPPWDLDVLARILVAAGHLAASGRDWIASLDVNPMVFGPDGFMAVDAVLLLRDSV
jgi:acyl-CoA synthetase (NDP forming)